MANINWYIKRLKKISYEEFCYRAMQFGKVQIDKFKKYPPKYEIRRINTPNACYNIKPISISTLPQFFPRITEIAIKECDLIVNGQFEIFGIPVSYKGPINWHLDPITNKTWPLRFWGDIDFRNEYNLAGIKFAWEINRLQHIPKLAICYALTHEPKYRDAIFQQLKGWIIGNPYPLGINWIMSIEAGIRITNILYALKYLNPNTLNSDERNIINYFVYVNANHILRYPSKFSSNGNHTLAEALGLYIAGHCFPFFCDASKWRKYGEYVLNKEYAKQILPDGGSFEFTTFYLQFVIDMILIYYLLRKESNLPIPAKLNSRLISALDFIGSILDENGNYPQIGDADDGYLLKIWFGEHNNFLSLLNTGAILFKESRWRRNVALDQKSILLLGCDSYNIWKSLKFQNSEKLLITKIFPYSGLFVLKHHDKHKLHLIFNASNLGLPPLAAHGHADALSFWLSINSQPVFVDPGTYLYHCAGIWRDYFRSTAAHNIIKIDDLDQATIIADFMWDNFYHILNLGFLKQNTEIICMAGHDGYNRLKDKVAVYRKIIYNRKNENIKIIDRIICKWKHKVVSYYHCHPTCQVESFNKSITISRNDICLHMMVDKKWQKIRIYHGSKNPLCGWYSDKFNQLQKCFSIVLESTIVGETEFTSTLTLVL